MAVTAPATTSREAVTGERSTRRRFRVLTIAPTSFFADYGCHVRILEETLALQELGSSVTICTYHSGNDLPGLDIRRCPRVPWCESVQIGSSPHRLYFDLLLSLRTLAAAIRVKPDIIHAHMHEGALIGGVLSRLWRVPLVFDFQGSLTSEMLDHGFISRGSLFYAPLRGLERHINGLARVVLTSSRNSAELLVRDFGLPVGRVQPLPDCVNTERFRARWEVDEKAKANLKARLGIPPDRKLVVYLGLLAEYQGSGQLLLAAAELLKRHSDLHFLLMGFPGQDRYRQMARELGIDGYVTIPGRVPYAEAPAHLALGDVAVSPKISETEGNGKLLNYMAVGLPTVTFDTPVSREILGELGVYAEAGNPLSLAGRLESLLYDPTGTSANLGVELRRRAVEEFSWQESGKRLVAIYESLTRPRR